MAFLNKKLTEATVKDVFKIAFTIYILKGLDRNLSKMFYEHNWYPYSSERWKKMKGR